MMTEVSFTVDPENLDALRGRLGAIESCMQGMGRTDSTYPWQELGSSPDVYEALQNFSSNWSNGLALISHNIQALTKLLTSAAGDYRGTDDQIAQAVTAPAGNA
jgi:hypothetical protein